jgi:hypothetical protein
MTFKTREGNSERRRQIILVHVENHSETTLMFTKVKVPFSGMQSMTNDIHFPPCLLQQIGSYPHTLYHAPALTG